MGTRAEQVVRDVLVGASITGSIYQGPVVDDPANAVFCIPTGGPAAESFFGQDPEQHHFRRVQVRVRDEVYSTGAEKALDCYDALRNAQPGAYSQVVIIRSQGSGPAYIGLSDKERHEWSINVIVELIE